MFSFPCRCTYAIFCYMSHTLIFYKLLNMNFILLLWKSKTEDFHILHIFFYFYFIFPVHIFNICDDFEWNFPLENASTYIHKYSRFLCFPRCNIKSITFVDVVNMLQRAYGSLNFIQQHNALLCTKTLSMMLLMMMVVVVMEALRLLSTSTYYFSHWKICLLVCV